MAPSSTRSIVATKIAAEIKKKKRRLLFLLKELESETSVYHYKYERIHSKVTALLESSNSRCFPEELDSIADILEEGVQKLSECNIVITVDDDTEDSELNVESNCSLGSSANCLLEETLTENQCAVSSSSQNGECSKEDKHEDCDSERSQCTVLVPIPESEPPPQEKEVDNLTEKMSLVMNAVEEPVCVQTSDVVDSREEASSAVKVPKVEDEPEEGEPMEGIVTHFVDPTEFYFIINEVVMFSDELSVELKQCIADGGNQKKSVIVPKVGQLFAVLCRQQELWMRVRILAVEEDNRVVVRKMDFGDIVNVSVEELVPMPEELVDVAALANRCSLYNVKPVAADWSEACKEEMSNLVLDSAGIKGSLRVRGEEVLSVDLLKKCTCDGQVLQVNVADYLVWRGFAGYSGEEPREEVPPQVNPPATLVRPAGSRSSSVCSEYDCSFEVPKVTIGENKKKEVVDIKKKQPEVGKISNLRLPNGNGAEAVVSNGDSTKGKDAKVEGLCQDLEKGSNRSYFGKPDVTISTVNAPCEVYGNFEASVAHINSPGDLYVYFQTDTVLEGMVTLDGMLRELAEESPSEEDKRSSFAAGIYCCAKLSTGEWCRCEIIEGNGDMVSTEQERDGRSYRVKVRALDVGVEDWVDVEDVRPMTRQMSELPAFAVKCFLEGIHPIGRESQVWTEEATREMQRLCPFGKIFFVNLSSKSDDGTLSILLWDMDKDNEESMINEKLFKLGLVASDMFKTTIDSNSDEECNNWDPMADDFLSERNRYAVDFDDAEVAVTAYKRQDEREICHFYHRGLVCKRGNSCQFKHIAPFERVTTDTKEVLAGGLNVKRLDVEDLAAVAVTAFLNPSRFFVNVLEDGDGSNEEYMKLFYALQEHCSKTKKREKDLTARATGEVIAAIFSDGFWYRARIIDSNEQYHRVKVFYVDSGHSNWVLEDDTRDLPMEFYHCPLQAIRCTLPNIEPLKGTEQSGRKWSNAACKHFSNLVSEKDLFALVTDKFQDHTLAVELYNTRDLAVQTISDRMIEAGFAQRRSSP